ANLPGERVLPAAGRILDAKKAPDRSGAFLMLTVGPLLLDPGHVSGLQTFRPLDHVKRYPIAFNKGFEAVAGDGGEMAKNIFAVFLLEKTKTLAVVKPFYRTVYHLFTFS